MQIARILVALGPPPHSDALLQQARMLARHFSAEVLLLNVLTALHYPAGILESGHELTGRDQHSPIVQAARAQLEEVTAGALPGLSVRRLLVRGETAAQIARVAAAEEVGLIMMSTHHQNGFLDLVTNPVTARVLQQSDAPLWTDARAHALASGEFALRRILCCLDLSGHSRRTLARAAQLATEFSAALAILHVTAGTEMFAPGGTRELPDLKAELFAAAAQQIEQVQRACGTNAEVILDSGDVLAALKRAVDRTHSELLVVGRLPPGGHLGEGGSGLGFLRESPVAVVSV